MERRVMWLLLWGTAMLLLAIPVVLWIPDYLGYWWMGGFVGAAAWLWGGERCLR